MFLWSVSDDQLRNLLKTSLRTHFLVLLNAKNVNLTGEIYLNTKFADAGGNMNAENQLVGGV